MNNERWTIRRTRDDDLSAGRRDKKKKKRQKRKPYSTHTSVNRPFSQWGSKVFRHFPVKVRYASSPYSVSMSFSDAAGFRNRSTGPPFIAHARSLIFSNEHTLLLFHFLESSGRRKHDRKRRHFRPRKTQPPVPRS